MDWFKGKFTGKSHISWENLWFPVDFPLNQSIISMQNQPDSHRSTPWRSALWPNRGEVPEAPEASTAGVQGKYPPFILPIGSMYGMYGNIYHILPSIYPKC